MNTALLFPFLLSHRRLPLALSRCRYRSWKRCANLAGALFATAFMFPVFAADVAQAQEKVVVSVPGPRNLSYLPIDLIPAIGADKEEGVVLEILHTGGGAVALNNLVTR